MGLTRKDLLKLVGAGAGAAAVTRLGAPLPGPVAASDVITRDVAIIGGGTSGTFAAIKLRDQGKSVVVVESQNRLGGHTQTWTDPATGGKVDIGVVVWHDLPIVRDFFARLGVPLTKANFNIPGRVTQYVDYRNGRSVAYTPPDPSAALGAYAAQLAQYPYLEAGFDLPDPIPPDLLLPFGDFVRKYSLDAAVPTIFSFGQGLGDTLRQPTLYVMKNFGLDILRNLAVGFLTTERRDNSEIYVKARGELGADTLLSSRVIGTNRNAPGGLVSLLVQTPSGPQTIRAKKLLITVPPKVGNLVGFDLDVTELALFAQFGNSGYYTGVLRNTGIPDNMTVENVGANTTYNLPALPGVYSIMPTGIPKLHSVKYGSAVQLPDLAVKADILASVRKLRNAGIPTSTPEFATFASHSPFELTVPTGAIRSGFYRKLYALQGRNRTYWTGAAFHTHDSSLLWQFTDALLPRVTA